MKSSRSKHQKLPLYESERADIRVIGKLLWSAKYFILLCFVSALFIAYYINANYYSVYKSRISYEITFILPYINSKEIENGFFAKVIEKENFDDWKRFQNSSVLSFENLTVTVSKYKNFLVHVKNDSLISFKPAQFTKGEIIIATDNNELVKDIHAYLVFTAKALEIHFKNYVQANLDWYKENISKFGLNQSSEAASHIQQLVSSQIKLQDGSSLFLFSKPSSTSRKGQAYRLRIYLLAVSVSLLFSVYCVFIFYRLRNYKWYT